MKNDKALESHKPYGHSYNIINANWVIKWRMYMTDQSEKAPGPVNNREVAEFI